MSDPPYRTQPARPRAQESVRPLAPERSRWSLVGTVLTAFDLTISTVLLVLFVWSAVTGRH